MPPIASDQPSPRGDADSLGRGPAAGRSEPMAPRPERSIRRTPPPHRRRRAPLPVAAAVATSLAALLSFLPVAIALGLFQFADGGVTIGGVARLGAAGWLLGHGVPLGTSAGRLGLPPLTLTLLAAWRIARAGVHVSRAIGARGGGSLRQASAASAAVGVAYGVIGALAAAAAQTDGLRISPVRAALTLAVFGVCAAFLGAMRTTGAIWKLAQHLPDVLRDGVRTGCVAALLMLAAGAGGAGLAVATSGGEASDMIAAYRTGVAGQAGITLVSAAYAPNAAVWAASYLLGPGFAVGTGSVVRTTEVTLGALPAVPLLVALPHGPVGGFGAALLAVPVVAGMTGGWLLARRVLRSGRGGAGWGGLLATAGASGPVAGVLLGLASLASGGPLGDGHLAEIGPVGWQVAAAATVLVAVGALIGAAATRAAVAR